MIFNGTSSFKLFSIFFLNFLGKCTNVVTCCNMENISNFTLTINKSYNINMTCFGITGLPDHIFKKVCVLENKRNSFVCPKYGLRRSSFLSLRYIGKSVNVATLQIVVLLNFVYSTWVTISYTWTTISRTIILITNSQTTWIVAWSLCNSSAVVCVGTWNGMAMANWMTYSHASFNVSHLPSIVQ